MTRQKYFHPIFFVVQYCAIACNKAVNLQIYKDNFLPLLLFDKPFGPIHLRIQPAYIIYSNVFLLDDFQTLKLTMGIIKI